MSALHPIFEKILIELGLQDQKPEPRCPCLRGDFPDQWHSKDCAARILPPKVVPFPRALR
jgi:hypothetical protein